jgi:GT2 family glycosyltransferase
MDDRPDSAASDQRVAIVMLTVNQRETTLRALRSLGPAISDWDILLWDNGSTDGTVDAVRREFPTVVVHHHPTNLGVASGRNAAARLAIGRFAPEYLLFLDNDMVVQPGFVEALRAPFVANPMLGQTQAKLLYLDEPTRINDGGGCRINFWLGITDPVGFKQIDRGQCDQVAPCISCGGAMMVRSRLFQELGGFDPVFDPFGPEDLDFSLRLQRRGYAALYIPQAVAYHAVSHSIGSGYTAAYARNKARHWLRFLQRHGSPLQKVGFAVVGAPWIALRMIVRELSRGNAGAIVGSIRGVIGGLRDADTRHD